MHREDFVVSYFSVTFLHQWRMHVSEVSKTLQDLSGLMFKEPIRVTGNSLSGCMVEVTVEM